MKVLGVIPARYNSTRFPGKPLAIIRDKTLIEHVYSKAISAKNLDDVYVATDDNRIKDTVEKFGGKVFMTSPDHESGSDRVAEAVDRYQKEIGAVDVVLIIQGDEPLINPSWLEQLIDIFKDNPDVKMGTCMRKITEAGDLVNPNVVKVVTDKNGSALYFSRIMIPFPKKKFELSLLNELEEIFKYTVYYQHIGLYAYRPDFLQIVTSLPQSPLEMIEGLEQLRVLEAGYNIRVIEVSGRSIGVDKPEDIDKVVSFFSTGENK